MKGKGLLPVALTAIWPGLGHIAVGSYKKLFGIVGATVLSHVPPFSLIGTPIRLGIWLYSMYDILVYPPDKDNKERPDDQGNPAEGE